MARMLTYTQKKKSARCVFTKNKLRAIALILKSCKNKTKEHFSTMLSIDAVQIQLNKRIIPK